MDIVPSSDPIDELLAIAIPSNKKRITSITSNKKRTREVSNVKETTIVELLEEIKKLSLLI